MFPNGGWVAQEPDLSLPWQLGIINITSDKMVEDMTIKDEFSTPLIITIITLAGSLLLVAAIYGCHQRLSQKKDQVRRQKGGTVCQHLFHPRSIFRS